MGFPGGSLVKNPPANAGDAGSIPGSGRSPGGGNDNPLQHSCLENPMDRGAWRATVHSHTKELDTTEQLNTSNRSVSSWIYPFLKTFAISLGIYNQEAWEIISNIWPSLLLYALDITLARIMKVKATWVAGDLCRQ